jgi:AbrB family looped-hinge helix DNA binding protein
MLKMKVEVLQEFLFRKAMILKMTSKRQVTFPRQVVEKLQLKEGDTLRISETMDGILTKPHRFDPGKLAPLRHLINADLPAPDLEEVRHAYSLDSSLRD